MPPRGLRAPSLHCRQSLAPSGSSLWAGKWGTPPGHSLFHRGVFYHLFTPSSRRGGRVFLPVSAGGPSGPAQGGPCDVVSPADSGGGARLSLEKAGGKNTREEEVLPPWTHLFWFGGTLRGSSLFSAWPAAHFPTPVTARPPAGRAGRGRNFGTRCAGIPKLGDAPRTAPAKLALSG